jgi:hypothetical protein
MRQWLCVVMLGCLLTACAPAAPATESTATPGGEIAGAADTAAPDELSTPAPSTADVKATSGGRSPAAVVFERGGGLDGSSEKWTIFTDGTITRDDGTGAGVQSVGSVTIEQVTALVTGLDSLGFFQLQEAYGANDNCADCYQYSVTVTNGNQTKTVTTHDAASDAPAELNQALEMIRALLATVS